MPSDNDLSALSVAAVTRFTQQIASLPDKLSGFMEVKRGEENRESIKPVDMYGIGDFTAEGTGSPKPTPDDLTTAGTAFSTTGYEKLITLREKKIAHNPGIVTDVADYMSRKAWSNITKLAMQAWAAASTIDHPDTNYTSDDAGVKLADDFATPVDQANLTTSALSASALSAAKKILRAYKTKDGDPADFAEDPMFLMVPPDLEQLARDLVGRTQEVYDGSTPLQPSGAWGISRIVVNHWLASNRWIIGSTMRNPFKLWLQKAPYFRAEPEPGAKHINVSAGYWAGMYYMPYEGGFVLNAP